VSGIAAAEVQADDPAKVAARWAEIAELPVTQQGDGVHVMSLQNADVRFVPVSDGRGEGLAGLDLKVADRDRLLAAADERGCRRDGHVVVAGMRINLV
jgi:hypothetical protein